MTATEEHVSGRQGADQPRRIRISRLRHGAAQPHVDEFDVAVGPDTTLLDALREIRSHQDRSLTLRYSCCHASCGTCGMRANGREVLACVTPLASLGGGPIRSSRSPMPGSSTTSSSTCATCTRASSRPGGR